MYMRSCHLLQSQPDPHIHYQNLMVHHFCIPIMSPVSQQAPYQVFLIPYNSFRSYPLRLPSWHDNDMLFLSLPYQYCFPLLHSCSTRSNPSNATNNMYIPLSHHDISIQYAKKLLYFALMLRTISQQKSFYHRQVYIRYDRSKSQLPADNNLSANHTWYHPYQMSRCNKMFLHWYYNICNNTNYIMYVLQSPVHFAFALLSWMSHSYIH